ncbi:F-box protein At1g47340-like [Aegilops tauschii subsp. strangulata]|nr:F-box protein At1g47340-like [Aegilops tauschii subsp. strangulata]
MLQEILMKLPTKDVARSCCVSRQWRSALGDPSFRKLHAASPAALSADPEFLRLSGVPCGLGQSVKTTVLSLSSDKPMCSIAKPDGCGLLCFVDERDAQAPALVCNPATGEILALPTAPPLSNKDHAYFFAFGFSPPTNEYKLLRLSFPLCSYSSEEWVDVDVYTLGGWRKDSFLTPSRPLTRGNDTSTPD